MDGDGSHADADAVMKATEDNCESDAAWLEQQMLNRTDINKEAGPEEGLRGTLREAGDKDHLLQGETATSFIMSEELKRSTQCVSRVLVEVVGAMPKSQVPAF